MIVTRLSLLAAIVLTVAAEPALAQEARQRLAPSDVAAIPIIGAGAGTSGLRQIETRLLSGDPSRPGPYTIAIYVPPNTHIAAHGHRDDRSAVVVKGLWHFGYGEIASDNATRALPVGSFYTEPAADPHFAWTGPEGATVYISGIGPSDTHYMAK